MMVAVVTIVFGMCASSSYGQSDCSLYPYCNPTTGYEIGGNIVLTEPGGLANYNIALGYQALISNTTGNNNTASGAGALSNNTTGSDNTASGYLALDHNITGNYNTASGWSALYANTTGYYNTASGYDALLNNTTGYYNMASGAYALISNTTGAYNTASGYDTFNNNTSGNYNTASGWSALYANTTGNYNTASGYNACANLVTGSNVICIGAGAGPAGDIPGPATYIAGIYGKPTTGSHNPEVCIDSTGKLGTLHCAANAAQQQQIETLQRQNEEFQQRIARLESLIAKK
jgi:hypothetical protein